MKKIETNRNLFARHAEAHRRQAAREGHLQHMDAAGAGPHPGICQVLRRQDPMRGLQGDHGRQIRPRPRLTQRHSQRGI